MTTWHLIKSCGCHLLGVFFFVNYLSCQSFCSNLKEALQGMSNAADAIAVGDLVSKIVRAESQWTLLPVQVRWHFTVLMTD